MPCGRTLRLSSRSLDRARLCPIQVQPALGKQPRALFLDEGVAIAKVRDHELAHALLRVDVVRQTVGVPRRRISVERDRALAVEVHRRFVRVEVLEHRRKGLPAMKVVGRIRSLAFHVDDEVVSVVKSAFWPSASRLSAQYAYASTSSRIANRSAASLGEI